MAHLFLVSFFLLSFTLIDCHSVSNVHLFIVRRQACYPLLDSDMSSFSASSVLNCLLLFCFVSTSQCSSVSFDSKTQQCNISISKYRMPVVFGASCTSYELPDAFVDVYTGLSLVAFWRLNSVKKGENLGIGGSSLDVQKQDVGVTYTYDSVEFGLAVSNLTVNGLGALGLKNFTFAFWINPDSISVGWKPWFHSTSLGTSHHSQFHILHGEQPGRVHVNTLSGNLDGQAVTKNSAPLVQAGKWNYVVYTNNLGTHKGSIFINSAEVSSYSQRETLLDGSQIGDFFYFGVYNPRIGSTGTFQGKMKCVSFSDRVLTVSEIKSLSYACE